MIVPVHVELDHRLSFVNSVDLTRKVCVLHFLLGNVCRKLNHFVRFAIEIEDWVVGSLNPNFLATLAVTFVLFGFVFATV